MGIKANLIYLDKFHYIAKFNNGLTENQIKASADSRAAFEQGKKLFDLSVAGETQVVLNVDEKNIRLLDVGGDKPAPYLDIPTEENPALGLRGIRVALARPEVLDAQLRAILSVPDVARCRIMVPMVASVDEMIAVRAALDALRDELGVGPVQLGAMVETPAAAATADLIAAHSDFLSVGSNDLTQYVLAMDRGNPALAAGIDGLHPAVLRLIEMTCRGAATRGVPVSVCGGLAADPLAAPILVGLGVRTLSVPPARVPAVKALVARLTLPAVQDLAAAALSAASAAEVRGLARRFAEEAAR
jgi:phosphocarrier protein